MHSHHVVNWSGLLQRGGGRTYWKRVVQICFTANVALFPSTVTELSMERMRLLQSQQPESSEGQAGSWG